jgi:hypothetical protein
MTTEPPIPGRTEEPPLATWQMTPPSAKSEPQPVRKDDTWVGKAKKKPARKRAR